MIKYLGLLLLLKSTFSEEDYNYKYEDYADDDVSNGDDYVFNKTEKAKPKRIFIDGSIDKVIADANHTGVKHTSTGDQNVHISGVKHRHPKRLKRDCNYTNITDNSPMPNIKDDIGTYPFMASVLRMGSHYASGALVDKRWVLSAAGVFYNVRESIKLYRVRLGSINCKRGGVLMPLQQIVIYPSYLPGKPSNDLAMLRLAEPVEVTATVRPVSLSERKEKVEVNKFLTMYWPRLIVDGVALPASAKERQQHTSMRVSTQRTLSWKQCSRALNYRLQELTHNSFCLRPLKQFHTFCLQPDVGAPVLSQDGLWGIISGWVGEPCTFQDPSPVVVTRITPPEVRFWLQSQFELDE